MKDNKDRADHDKNIRKRAEEKTSGSDVQSVENLETLSSDETKRLLHELRIHQIELEMQNEELRRVQEELEDSRARYFDLYDLAPVGYVTISEKGLILEANLTAAGMLGVKKSELIKQRITRFILPEDQDIYYGHRKQLYESGAAQVCELRMFHDGCVPLWGRIEAIGVKDADGATICRATISDITAQKQAEAALLKAEEKLRQSIKMEAIGRLAGGVAHDFNNMLTVINNYAEFILAELKPGDPVRPDVEEILKAGQRSAELTRQLLAFSRKQVLAPEIIDVNSVVTSIEKMIRRLLGEDIDIEIRSTDSTRKLKADPGQIEQVILNLAINARDAMPGGGKLTIEISDMELAGEHAADHPELTPGKYIVFSVTDTGSGMDKAIKDLIFEPFFTTKEIGKGTGLGLSTVYGIVKQSGWDINVSSEPGKGTTFEILIPNEVSGDEPATGTKKKRNPKTATETILIVEDEIGVRNLVKRVLEDSGYTVYTAANGPEALLLCESEGNSIRLMVTDVVMPEMSGSELAERISRICPNMKVLFMSGYTENTIVHQGVLDKGINFINKPFSLSDLTTKVRQVLNGE